MFSPPPKMVPFMR